MGTPHGEKITVPAPVQTQIVVLFEQGVLGTDPYDLAIHGEMMDIPLMEISPPELEEQFSGESGTKEVPLGQVMRNTRREGTSNKKWPPKHYPPVRHR